MCCVTYVLKLKHGQVRRVLFVSCSKSVSKNVILYVTSMRQRRNRLFLWTSACRTTLWMRMCRNCCGYCICRCCKTCALSMRDHTDDLYFDACYIVTEAYQQLQPADLKIILNMMKLHETVEAHSARTLSSSIAICRHKWLGSLGPKSRNRALGERTHRRPEEDGHWRHTIALCLHYMAQYVGAALGRRFLFWVILNNLRCLSLTLGEFWVISNNLWVSLTI